MRFSLKSGPSDTLHLLFDPAAEFWSGDAASTPETSIEQALEKGDLVAWANTYKATGEFEIFVDEPVDPKYDPFIMDRREGILHAPSGRLVAAPLGQVALKPADKPATHAKDEPTTEIDTGLYAVEATTLDVDGWELRINSAKLEELLSALPMRRSMERLEDVTVMSLAILAISTILGGFSATILGMFGLFKLDWERSAFFLFYVGFPLMAYYLILWALWRLPSVVKYHKQRDAAFRKSSREAGKIGTVPRTVIHLTRIEDGPRLAEKEGCLFGAGAPGFTNIIADRIGSVHT